MKTNGTIDALRAIRCHNDHEYGHRVIWPLMDYLGIPGEARRVQFPIENPFGNGLLRLDYLVHVGDVPVVTVEGEPRANQFDEGYRQARNYSTNFKPRHPDAVIREMTVPFVLVAAGNRLEMRRAVARGLNIEYEPVTDGGRPAFLEWHEIQAEAARLGGTVGEGQPVLKADAARQFFEDLYAPIDSAPTLRRKDDQKIILFNRVIELARQGDLRRIAAECGRAGLSARAVGRVRTALDWYQRKVEANEFAGAAVARGYRNFLVQPAGHGGHQYFTGESQHRPYRQGGRIRYRNVARYFTPTEVIQQMVRLADPRSDERVIDMTCGSGGFLAECADRVARQEGESRGRAFLSRRLVGVDDDPFCVSCSRALLTFLDPGSADGLQVYQHNCLYRRAPRDGEIDEDRRAEPRLRPGTYDLVIGNPPGNDEYSGSNPEFVADQWARRFGHTGGGLMDHHCFLRRAVELARPDGGRVCLLVPEGLLSRDNRDLPELRRAILAECELGAVISLPQVFKNNHAQMAIVYLVRNTRRTDRPKTFMANVHPTWVDDAGQEQPTNLFAELETVVDQYAATAGGT